MNNANKIYDALIEVAISSLNQIPPLGSTQAPAPDLLTIATNLCDAFEIVANREASWIQSQQLHSQEQQSHAGLKLSFQKMLKGMKKPINS